MQNHAAPASGIAPPDSNANPTGLSERVPYGPEGLPKLTPEPISPESVVAARYERRHCFERILGDPLCVIPQMTVSTRSPTSHATWVPQEHPEGQRYYTKTIDNFHYYTDSWMDDQDTLKDVDAFAHILSSDISAFPNLPPDTEVVLHLSKDETDKNCCFYYLASESGRSVFWLKDVETSLVTSDVRPIRDITYLKDAIEAQYWFELYSHVNLFPQGRTVSTVLLDEANEVLNTLSFDAFTSESSTSPYDYDDLQKILAVSRDIRVGAGGHSVWVLARIMLVITWERFVNMHGQREARLDRQKSMFEHSPHESSRLLRLVSPLFFNLPLQYLKELEKIWVDRTVNYKPWRSFITNLQRDWENSITPATVLLTANVGLLAIQSIDTDHTQRSMAQIASYISTFLSLGNIILCTILARQHRLDDHMTAESAAVYLDGRTRMRGGLELVAISFSLPSALFLWGMGAFYVAIAWVCLAGTSSLTRLLSGTTFALITIFVSFTVLFDLWSAQSWQSTPLRWLDSVSNLRRTMREAFKPCLGKARRTASLWRIPRPKKRRGTDDGVPPFQGC